MHYWYPIQKDHFRSDLLEICKQKSQSSSQLRLECFFVILLFIIIEYSLCRLEMRNGFFQRTPYSNSLARPSKFSKPAVFGTSTFPALPAGFSTRDSQMKDCSAFLEFYSRGLDAPWKFQACTAKQGFFDQRTCGLFLCLLSAEVMKGESRLFINDAFGSSWASIPMARECFAV